jgi:hypothetical protein
MVSGRGRERRTPNNFNSKIQHLKGGGQGKKNDDLYNRSSSANDKEAQDMKIIRRYKL